MLRFVYWRYEDFLVICININIKVFLHPETPGKLEKIMNLQCGLRKNHSKDIWKPCRLNLQISRLRNFSTRKSLGNRHELFLPYQEKADPVPISRKWREVGHSAELIFFFLFNSSPQFLLAKFRLPYTHIHMDNTQKVWIWFSEFSSWSRKLRDFLYSKSQYSATLKNIRNTIALGM